MEDKLVQIVYEAIVKGQEKVEELARKNQELQQTTDQYKRKLEEATKVHEKHETVGRQLRRTIIDLRREFFAFGVVAGTLTGILVGLSKTSDQLASALATLSKETATTLRPIGDFLAKGIRFLGGKGFTAPDLSLPNQARLAGLFSEIARLEGNTREALNQRLRAEEIQAQDQLGQLYTKTYERVYKRRRELIEENFALEELGLKRLAEIERQFKRDVVGALRGGLSETIFGVLQGERKTGAEILGNFTSGINRAIAEAVSQALFTSLFSGGGFFQNFMNAIKGKNQTTIAVEQSNEKLEDIRQTNARIADCICVAAETMRDMSARIPASVSLDAPKQTGLQKAIGVANAIAGLGVFVPTGGGAGTPANIQGGFPGGSVPTIGPFPGVPHMQHGGEVPAYMTPGEFVVRRGAARMNKDILEDMNAGRPVRGAQNVFLIRTNDAASFAQMLASPSARAQLEVQVMRAIMENGSVRNVIREFAR